MKISTIIGSGLAEALLAHYMVMPRYEVVIFESRSDIKKLKGRSINLPSSCRGITGLAAVDLLSEVEKIIAPMSARALKDKFPDAYQGIPYLVNEFMHLLTGKISTTAQFFNQEMNSAFENCRLLGELDHYEDNFQQVMPAIYSLQKVNTDAVAEISMDTFYEIQFIKTDRAWVDASLP